MISQKGALQRPGISESCPQGLKHCMSAQYRAPFREYRLRTAPSVCASAASLRFRKAKQEDVPVIRRWIFQESMNPLGIKPERFTVAEDNQGSLLGFGQLEPKEGCVELRSMVVDTAHRGQGIGRQVLRKLLEEAGSQEVIMTTISSRIPFYEPEGFERLQLKDVPRFLLFEVVAGTAVARIAAGEELVVLRRKAGHQSNA